MNVRDVMRWRGWVAVGLVLGAAWPWGAQASDVVPAAPAAPAVSAVSAPDCPPDAPQPTPERMQRVAAEARDRGFLWRIEQGGRSSWLYGTIHLGELGWLVPGPQVMAALRGSDVAAFELDATDAPLMARLQEGMAAQARDTRAPAVPDDLARRLAAQVAAACAPPALVDTMGPEMLATVLTMMSARRDGLYASFGIDPVLAMWARRLGKPVVSLETPEQQLQLLRSGSEAELRETLDKALRALERDQARPMLRRVAQVWADGNDAEMARYREWCDCAETAQERAQLRSLLDERNAPMAERIDTMHRQGQRVFVAVGSLHLFGPRALPELLETRGYRVVRVPLAP